MTKKYTEHASISFRFGIFFLLFPLYEIVIIYLGNIFQATILKSSLAVNIFQDILIGMLILCIFIPIVGIALLLCGLKGIKKLFPLMALILFDIFTKYWVNRNADPDIDILGSFLKFTHVKNTGVAFGTPLPGITFLIPLILLGIGVFLWKSWNKISEIEKTGYLMIITGGLLNALERTIFGSVTDFISVQYFSVFNVADIAITAGVTILLFHGLSGK